MKNIHVLPTDKSSRLIIYSTLLNEFRLLDEPIEDWEHKKNIYITSDEEIKEGDLGTDGTLLGYYGFDGDGCPILKNTKNNTVYEFGLAPHAKKIILTTDEDLIKDGVQAIDDEFLEWFVKNPTCEWVNIKNKLIITEVTNGILRDIFNYKIIIPKEELERGITITHVDKQEPDYTALLQPVGTKQEIDMSKYIVGIDPYNKQETLEEAADKWVFQTNGIKWSNNDDTAGDNYGSFISGAKWQRERMLKFILDEDNHTEGELGNSCIDVQTLVYFIEQSKKK